MTVARLVSMAALVLAVILHLSYEGFQQCQARRRVARLQSEIEQVRHRRDVEHVQLQAALFSVFQASEPPAELHFTSHDESGASRRQVTHAVFPTRSAGATP